MAKNPGRPQPHGKRRQACGLPAKAAIASVHSPDNAYGRRELDLNAGRQRPSGVPPCPSRHATSPVLQPVCRMASGPARQLPAAQAAALRSFRPPRSGDVERAPDAADRIAPGIPPVGDRLPAGEYPADISSLRSSGERTRETPACWLPQDPTAAVGPLPIGLPVWTGRGLAGGDKGTVCEDCLDFFLVHFHHITYAADFGRFPGQGGDVVA